MLFWVVVPSPSLISPLSLIFSWISCQVAQTDVRENKQQQQLTKTQPQFKARMMENLKGPSQPYHCFCLHVHVRVWLVTDSFTVHLIGEYAETKEVT